MLHISADIVPVHDRGVDEQFRSHRISPTGHPQVHPSHPHEHHHTYGELELNVHTRFGGNMYVLYTPHSEAMLQPIRAA